MVTLQLLCRCYNDTVFREGELVEDQARPCRSGVGARPEQWS